VITVYVATGNKVDQRALSLEDPLPEGTVWIDLLRPSDEERLHVATLLGVDLPTKADMEEIQVSSRLYVEDGVHYMTSLTTAQWETETPQIGPVTYVLTQKQLVTLRYIEPKFLPLLAARCVKHPVLVLTPENALASLLESVVDRGADVLETLSARVDRLSHLIFEPHGHGSKRVNRSKQYRRVLTDVGRAAELVGMLRDSLSGYERLTVYAASATRIGQDKDGRNRLKTVTRDLQSLAAQADNMSNRLAFLLDATLGLVGVEQNEIVKIFTVASIAFFPPTLVGTLYGMNFKHMPELDWAWGYPYALLLMVSTAILPLWWFRRRGWL
jgi:magnesium transporter